MRLDIALWKKNSVIFNETKVLFTVSINIISFEYRMLFVHCFFFFYRQRLYANNLNN